MNEKKTPVSAQQGHWVLAAMGKRVLRPGGKELTEKMIDGLNITPNDAVVEFAPGLGFTAELALRCGPRSYTGVEMDEAAAAELRRTIDGDDRRIVIGDAAQSGLPDASADKVYGEAMLTMQNDRQKSAIVSEAYRLLKPGGLYGIHEMGLTPDDVSDETKRTILRDLSSVIQVNARPLTAAEWSDLLVANGFEIVRVETSPMHLLEVQRVIDDEGLLRAVKIWFNILTHAEARERILAMRDTFRRHMEHINAVAIVAVKK